MRRRREVPQTFRFIGIPVSCEIFAELDSDGIPNILRSIEIVGAKGNRVLSQSYPDESEVLLIYRNWRRRKENHHLIQRIETDIFENGKE